MKSVPLNQSVFVLKHKGADHPVASGIYRNREQALADLESIPGSKDGNCSGCGVGCYSEYEVVAARIVSQKMTKLPVSTSA